MPAINTYFCLNIVEVIYNLTGKVVKHITDTLT